MATTRGPPPGTLDTRSSGVSTHTPCALPPGSQLSKLPLPSSRGTVHPVPSPVPHPSTALAASSPANQLYPGLQCN